DQGSRSCLGPELGVGTKPARAPLCFASLDVDGRLAVAARSSPPPGLDGDSLTVAFSGRPSGPSGDAVATTVPFSGQPRLRTVTVDVPLLEDNSAPGGNHDGRCDAGETCRLQFRRAPARRVVQVGQSVDGHALASVAVDALDATASPTEARPRTGEYLL